jgi:aspartate/glutamate racemase
MKTIGILGGMSAASTQIYYRESCTTTRERLGGLHSPELLIRSLDFAKANTLKAIQSLAFTAPPVRCAVGGDQWLARRSCQPWL